MANPPPITESIETIYAEEAQPNPTPDDVLNATMHISRHHYERLVEAQAAAQRPTAPHVYVAMNEVMAAIGAIGITKDHTGPSQQGSYKFRGIDDVYNALNPIMADRKLLMVPVKATPEYHVVPNSRNSGIIVYCRVVVTFDLISAVDGSKTTAETIGEGMDTSDKASNKSLSAAMKYASLMVFMIPTEGGMTDSEEGSVSPEHSQMRERSGGYGRDDDFPGDRQSTSQRADPRQTLQNQRYGREDSHGRPNRSQTTQGNGGRQNASTGQKNSSQAKKDGDWDLLERVFKLQRTEEELIAAGKANENVLARLPPKWKQEARDLYAHHLNRVRLADEERALRDADSRDPNRRFDEQEEEEHGGDDEVGFGG